MSVEDEVLEASQQFYAALNRMLAGDATALADVWSQTPSVTTMHPIGGREVGWVQVKAVFERVAASSTDGYVEMSDRLIRVMQSAAYEVGTETAQFTVAGQPLHVNSRVTNVYSLENGAWKIVHHHGDKARGIAEALDRASA